MLGHLGWDYLGNWEVCTCNHFPISQIVLAHLGLGNWEIGKYVPQASSQFPNFPNRAGPSGLVSFGKLGNWEICTCNHFSISQIMLAHLGWGLLGNWEIGKHDLKPFPYFPISQIVLSQMDWGLLGNWEFGKWLGRNLFVNRGCVYKHGLGAPINIQILSPCLFINARCVYQHGFGTRIVTQNVHYC